jgi:hypothetical protein
MVVKLVGWSFALLAAVIVWSFVGLATIITALLMVLVARIKRHFWFFVTFMTTSKT